MANYQLNYVISELNVIKLASFFKNPTAFFVDLKTFLDAKGVNLSPTILSQLAETDIRADSVTEGIVCKKIMG